MPFAAMANGDCAGARSNPAVDLRSEFGPLRSQDSIGWCATYATTDLYSHWIYKNSAKKSPRSAVYDTRYRENMVSAMWGTAKYYNERRRGHINDLRNFFSKKKELVKEFNALQVERNSLFKGLYETTNRVPNKTLGLLYRDLLSHLEQEERTNGDVNRKHRQAYEEIKKEIINLHASDPSIDAAISKLNLNADRMAHVQLTLKNIENIGDLETGDPVKLFGLLANDKEGYCRESEVPSDDVSLSEQFSQKKNIDQLMKDVYQFLIKARPSQEQFNCAVDSASKLFPNVPVQEVSSILRVYQNDGDPIYELAKASCKNKTRLDEKIATPEMIVIDRPALNGFENIKKLLAQGVPIEIEYDGNRAINPASLVDRNSRGTHASIIVGQQYNCKTGETEFIVRDSVGGKDNCDYQIKLFERYNEKAPYSCSDGYFVLPQSHLAKYIVKGFAIKTKDAK